MDGTLPAHINADNDKILGHLSTADATELLELIRQHHALTGSSVAEHILADWNVATARFLKVSFQTAVVLQFTEPVKLVNRLTSSNSATRLPPD